MGIALLKNIIFCFVFFNCYSTTALVAQARSYRVALKSQSAFQQERQKYSSNIGFIRLAETDSIFDESDLIDIESGSEADLQNEDDLLEKEFDNIEEDQSETNFDPEDFEELEIESESAEEGETAEEEFDSSDYEVLSDRPGYEVLTDEELEKEFEEGIPAEDDLLEEESFEDLESEELVSPEDEEALEGFNPEEPQQTEDQEEELSGEGDMGLEELSEDTEEVTLEDTDTEDSLLDGEEPMVEEPVVEEPMVEEPMVEEPMVEEPVVEEPMVEEPMVEEPVVEEPMVEEPMVEEPFDKEEGGEISDNSSLNLITNIRYLIEFDQIVIDSSEVPSYKERVNEKNNQLIIEIFQARLAKNLSWPYIMRDFDTDFGLLKADQKDSSTVRVIVQLKPEAPIPPIALTDEGGIVIGKKREESFEKADSIDLSTEEALPSKTLKDLYFGDIDFVGDPISFHVIDADVRQVLRFISEESGLNMVIDETVQGKLTLKLEDVPWDQALYTIFKVNSLGYLRDGNIITILPLQKIQDQTTQLKEISDRQKGLSPFETKVIPIMYGKAKDIEGKVKDFSTPAIKDLTPGGRIIVHEESNSLIVMDNAEAIQKIEKLAKFLDYPSQQVMVESKIVEVTKLFSRNFGLNWNLSGDLPVRIGANGLLDFFQTAFDSVGASWSVRNKGQANSFNLNGLPFIGNVDATLNLAENNGIARVLNTSKILVESGKSGTIDKNSPILIPNSDISNLNQGTMTTTFEPQDVKFTSTVTPTVTSAGSIAMNVNVTLSNPGPGSEGGAGATTITRNATTEIVAKNGQTIVLSGIYQKSENRGQNGLPLLRKIPLLGFLFNDSTLGRQESEMLMFITPTLVEN